MIWVLLSLITVGIFALGYLLRKLIYLEQDRAAIRVFLHRLLDRQEHDRKRIAEELHGSLGQNLLVLKNRAELALASADPGPTREQLQEISKVCSSAIEDVRNTSHLLGTRHLEQIGLTDALDAMLDRVAASTGINFERRLEPVDDLFRGESAASFYRIAQEALNNMMKHAHASQARVELLRDLRHVQLAVEDNGCGFDRAHLAEHARAAGLGLTVIAERVRCLKGEFQIRSSPGNGTLLKVLVPVQDGQRV
jgi:signal transduction histidine kinase